jgi:rhodanese-related sulfurtransferase
MSEEKQFPPEIDPGEHMAISGGAVFIDVREREEWDMGHIEGARHLPLSALLANLGLFTPPDEGRCAIIYCQKGGRSRRAAEMLLQAGFMNIYNLKGGYEGWRRSGLR